MLSKAKNVHAIGDRANRIVLNAMAAVIGNDSAAGKDRRLRLEHAQIMSQDDLQRAARLGSTSAANVRRCDAEL